MAHKLKQTEEKTSVVPIGQHEVAPRMEHHFDTVFDRMFEDLWRRPFAERFFREGMWPFSSLRASHPSMDIYDEAEALMMKVELPGLAKEDLSINISGNLLTLKGEKKREEKIEDRDYYRCERTYGTFSRTVELPATVIPEQVSASFKNGVLEIRLPKAEEAKRKEVRVRVE